ncbi:MAG: phosphoglycerate dehydrogenase [Desulfovibrio sp.]|nr:phosphoglycerate dehydrogenase [Desulfovibrio sp.]
MKALVTPRSFGKENPDLFLRLERAGLEVVRNTTGATLDEAAMLRLLPGCAGIIVGLDPLGRKVIDSDPELRAISKYGVGLDNIDLELCAKRGIKVSRTLGANTNAVADYALALILGVARRVALIDRRCREGDWGKITTLDVFGKTLGIVGLGAIGKQVARRAAGFEMRVLASDEVWDEEFANANNVVRADIDRICAEADFISLHCNLTDRTRNLINEDRIAMMKKTAIIVNTARGELIDEKSLLAALEAGRIWGAGLDVFASEPPENPDWYRLDNVIMGSHCSASTRGAVELMGSMAVDNLLRDLGLGQ